MLSATLISRGMRDDLRRSVRFWNILNYFEIRLFSVLLGQNEENIVKQGLVFPPKQNSMQVLFLLTCNI
ncbi:hypothetical protein CDAR_280031 [Caerostris darwini]|uniref:Uncharacterized protein n=1 Tax=Caerostris darwini TaxID=1538125 RepID=A0AAV4PHJ6_9ARAC|nr:hypothetical protein CDAR_280031 [Caerostris darwini]